MGKKWQAGASVPLTGCGSVASHLNSAFPIQKMRVMLGTLLSLGCCDAQEGKRFQY